MSLSEVIEIAVAVGTLALAFVTWRMARATHQLAEGSEAQLELLRRSVIAAEAANSLSERQTVAAEAANAAAERRSQEAATPRLILERATGDEVFGGSSERGEFSLRLRNAGGAPATAIEVRVTIQGYSQPIFLSPHRQGPLAPDEQGTFGGSGPPDALALVDSGRVPLRVSVTYSRPTGEQFNMQATLRGKGDRWIVSEPERHKGPMPAPRV